MVINSKGSDQKYKDKRKNRDYERKLLKKQQKSELAHEESTSEEDSEQEHVAQKDSNYLLPPVEIDFDEETIQSAHKKKANLLVIDNQAAGHGLPRKWRPEEDEIDYSNEEESDKEDGSVHFNIPTSPTTIKDLLDDESVQKVFDRKAILYMSAKEKHAARQARKKAREAFNSLQSKSEDTENQSTEHLLKTPSLAPKEETVVDKIYRLYLKTVQFNDITTAKMSKVISNLNFFGFKDADFFLPPGKRSAPVSARSAFYFYQTASQKASKKSVKKDQLLKQWKELNFNDKEYYLRQSELDRIRYLVQSSQYAELISKQNEIKSSKTHKMERKISGKLSSAHESSDDEIVIDSSSASHPNSTSSNKRSHTKEAKDSDEDIESELNTEYNKHPDAQQFSFTEGIEDDMENLAI